MKEIQDVAHLASLANIFSAKRLHEETFMQPKYSLRARLARGRVDSIRLKELVLLRDRPALPIDGMKVG